MLLEHVVFTRFFVRWAGAPAGGAAAKCLPWFCPCPRLLLFSFSLRRLAGEPAFSFALHPSGLLSRGARFRSSLTGPLAPLGRPFPSFLLMPPACCDVLLSFAFPALVRVFQPSFRLLSVRSYIEGSFQAFSCACAVPLSPVSGGAIWVCPCRVFVLFWRDTFGAHPLLWSSASAPLDVLLFGVVTRWFRSPLRVFGQSLAPRPFPFLLGSAADRLGRVGCSPLTPLALLGVLRSVQSLGRASRRLFPLRDSPSSASLGSSRSRDLAFCFYLCGSPSAAPFPVPICSRSRPSGRVFLPTSLCASSRSLPRC